MNNDLMQIIVPLVPSGFNISDEIYAIDNLTVTFEWDGPQGSGPQAIVDNYTVFITPRPLLLNEFTVLPKSLMILHVTLNYNMAYTAAITSENCAGESEKFVYPSAIRYGKQFVLPCMSVPGEM